MKFIQITSATLLNNQQTQANWILHALDEEGRIWELDDMHGWREVPLPVPAGEADEKKSSPRVELGCAASGQHAAFADSVSNAGSTPAPGGYCSRDRRESMSIQPCDNYSRPKGVMGGPCLKCGRSQPEHVHRRPLPGEPRPGPPKVAIGGTPMTLALWTAIREYIAAEVRLAVCRHERLEARAWDGQIAKLELQSTRMETAVRELL